MGMTDKFKDLKAKTEKAAVDHKDELHKAVDKAEQLADERTQGKYHDQLDKLASKADAQLDDLAKQHAEAPTPDPGASTPPTP